jgi:anti-sigma factor RsiW
VSCGEKAGWQLEAYADDQLDLVRSMEMERHISGCEDCSEAVKSHRALQSALRDASLRFETPKRLEGRVRAELAKAATPSKDARPFGWRWLAVAASLPSIAILAGALALVSRTPSGRDLLNQEIVSAHVRSLMADHLTDVPSSDQHTVKPWFNGKLDFSPEVKDLSGDGYPLVGGRLDYLSGRGVAVLVYARRQHSINLFIWPEPNGARVAAEEASLRGYNLIRWSRAGTSYTAVSDLNLAELRQFVGDLGR